MWVRRVHRVRSGIEREAGTYPGHLPLTLELCTALDSESSRPPSDKDDDMPDHIAQSRQGIDLVGTLSAACKVVRW